MNSRDLAPSEATRGQATELLADVASHGYGHLDEVERDLAQMDALLEAAIGKLSAAFMALHEAAARQQAALEDCVQAGRPVVECTAMLRPLREDVERFIAAAVTGLQFQDMTSQLIGRMAGHLAGVRDIFGTLDAYAAALGGGACLVHDAALAPLNERIALHGANLAAHAPRKVVQHHMESGDIELF